jgi:structural maintenance of chromosome 4
MPLGTVVLRNECLLSWQLEALKGQHSDLSQQLGALRSGAVPKQEELDQIQNLEKEIAEGESLLTDLNRKSKKLREKAKELQDKLENAGGERLKQQKILILKLEQNINQTSTDINRRKVLVTTSSKTLQKLQKSVEDATIDRDKGTKEKERLVAEFKEIESKAFVTQEKYTHLQEVSFVSVPLKLLLGYINNLLYDITNGLFLSNSRLMLMSKHVFQIFNASGSL